MNGAVAGALFGTLLVAACVWDLRTRRVPNGLVVCIAVSGLAYSVAVAAGAGGLLRALGGLAIGLAMWVPFYLLRLIGAGDVKFFAAASTWLGAATALRAGWLAALFGAALALTWMVRAEGWRLAWTRTALSLRRPLRASVPAGGGQGLPVTQRVPYAVAMAAGLAGAAWLPHLSG